MKSTIRLKMLFYRRSLTTALIIASVVILYIWRDSSLSRGSVPSLDSFAGWRSASRTQACPMDAGYLKQRHDLTSEVVYHKQCIRATASSSVDRDDIVDIPANTLFDQSQVLDLGRPCHDWHEMPCEPIDLQVPPPYPTREYTEFTFGVATSFERLIDSIPQFSHWLSGSGARLVAVVVDLKDHGGDIGYLKSLYKDYDIDLVVSGPFHESLGVNEQHFTIVRDLLKHMTPTTKWLGIIDDDTFFPSLYPLAEILDEQDHNTGLYLGGLSESLDAVKQHGMMAYGGAGAFLSLPLARQLDPVIETCLGRNNLQQGDALLKYCIYSQTDVRLTLMPGLNQQDIMGNPDGFYESGRLPVSLHHWKSWHWAPVDHIAKASKFCGDCILQRWRFGHDTVLSNGYSIVVYSDGITQMDLNRTEGTFAGPHLYDWSLGPLREQTKEGMKKSYHLVESSFVGTSLRQVYVHRARDRIVQDEHELGDATHMRDEVVELLWQRESWTAV